ncbi:MAG TPA: HD domain-containing protein, partial [Methanoregula sp.]|nr:HD domain-containing protein [Methanoregula sp.]
CNIHRFLLFLFFEVFYRAYFSFIMIENFKKTILYAIKILRLISDHIMLKNFHEFRDPIHTFIKMDSTEKKVLESFPFQRLRYIRQLSTTYLLYPAANHSRFEHSLGVMELASRVFDTITDPDNLNKEISELIPEIRNDDAKRYWRRVLRMAALCHDIGHLPFSHGAESELLPEGWDHEQITKDLIVSPEMKEIWSAIKPPLTPNDIAKLAIGPKKLTTEHFSDWEALLSEIIVGNSFGVDRMDYLLRDSHHIGVAYGQFDHYRLIDTIRILPSPPEGPDETGTSKETTLGIEQGGLQSAESLLLARYFMFSQVYYHRVRRIYDIHLRDFLKEWLPGGYFPINIHDFLRLTDNEVLSAMYNACLDETIPGHDSAKRIIERSHFKRVYEYTPDNKIPNEKINLDAPGDIYKALKEEYGEDKLRFDQQKPKSGANDFPVLRSDGRVVSALSLSESLNHIPPVRAEFIFAHPDISNEATQWVEKNKKRFIELKGEQ